MRAAEARRGPSGFVRKARPGLGLLERGGRSSETQPGSAVADGAAPSPNPRYLTDTGRLASWHAADKVPNSRSISTRGPLSPDGAPSDHTARGPGINDRPSSRRVIVRKDFGRTLRQEEVDVVGVGPAFGAHAGGAIGYCGDGDADGVRISTVRSTSVAAPGTLRVDFEDAPDTRGIGRHRISNRDDVQRGQGVRLCANHQDGHDGDGGGKRCPNGHVSSLCVRVVVDFPRVASGQRYSPTTRGCSTSRR